MWRLAFVMLWVASPVWAQEEMHTEVQWERLTAPEIEQRIHDGVHTIIIPTGGVEPNGAHLATGKHNAIVGYTAQRVATLLGNALVAPVIAYVPESGHMPKAGTISLSPATFKAVLRDAASSFKAQGITTIVFMGDSAENQRPQQELADELNKALARQGVRVLALKDYYANNGEEAWLKKKGLSIASPSAHAGFLDTAELWAASVQDVRHEQAPGLPDAKRYGHDLLMLKVQAAVQEIRQAKRPDVQP